MYTQDDLALVDGMNKQRLREACKAAAIKNYSKMTVEKMREALRLHISRGLLAAAPPVMETAFKVPPKVEPAPSAPAPEMKPVKRSKPKDAALVAKREVRNGVKRPLDPTSKCGQVWAALDELVANGETDLTTAIHAISDKKGWNKTNTSLELSAYRRFYGISKETKAA